MLSLLIISYASSRASSLCTAGAGVARRLALWYARVRGLLVVNAQNYTKKVSLAHDWYLKSFVV